VKPEYNFSISSQYNKWAIIRSSLKSSTSSEKKSSDKEGPDFVVRVDRTKMVE